MKKRSGKSKKWNLSLSGKVTALIVFFILFSAITWISVMFLNMKKNAQKNAMADEVAYMNNLKNNADNIEDVCKLTKQIVSENYRILDYIKVVQQGEDFSGNEKIELYNTEIYSLYNMTEINPDLFHIRLFANADVVEKSPVFYKIDRLENMEWVDTYRESLWQMDYVDNAVSSPFKTKVRLAGIVDEVRDDSGELLAVIEVATELDTLFSGFNTVSDTESSCFIKNDGEFIVPDDKKEFWKKNKNDILTFIQNSEDQNESVEMEFNGEESIVSILDMGSMDGIYVHIVNTAEMINSYYTSQTSYILVVFMTMLFFSGIVIISVGNIFKRFNRLTTSVREIKSGRKIRLPEEGNDEISELGKQINDMLAALEKLNAENINKQLLVKNAEIKSLQNQINAHFMYNVLETIKMMAEIKEDYEISDSVTSLGEMFRYSVKWSSGMVELNEEIKYIQNYLNLLNLRFEFEIFLSLNIPQKFHNIKIPKMSLQPLIENAVYHGLENIAEDSYIYIKVFEKDDIINIEVSDPGEGMDEQTLSELRRKINSVEEVDEQADHGRALNNVQKRLKMYFGQEYGLQIFSKEGMYTKVLIQIPGDKENKL